MTMTAHPISGHLVSLDEQQRITAVVAAVRGPVAVIGDAPALAAALAAADGVSLCEPGEDERATYVAVSPSDAPLDDATVAIITEHSARGGTWAVDTVPLDPARDEFASTTSNIVALVQCDVIGSLLTDEHDALQGAVRLGSDVVVAAGPHGRRSVLLGNLGQLDPAPAAEVVLFPHDADELARLRSAVRELELTNRRLAEGRLGAHDAAAARAASAVSELAKVRAYARELEEQLDSARFHAKQNDELFQDARLQLFAANARAGELQAELRRHQVEPRRLAKRAIAAARNRLRPR